MTGTGCIRQERVMSKTEKSSKIRGSSMAADSFGYILRLDNTADRHIIS